MQGELGTWVTDLLSWDNHQWKPLLGHHLLWDYLDGLNWDTITQDVLL